MIYAASRFLKSVLHSERITIEGFAMASLEDRCAAYRARPPLSKYLLRSVSTLRNSPSPPCGSQTRACDQPNQPAFASS